MIFTHRKLRLGHRNILTGKNYFENKNVANEQNFKFDRRVSGSNSYVFTSAGWVCSSYLERAQVSWLNVPMSPRPHSSQLAGLPKMCWSQLAGSAKVTMVCSSHLAGLLKSARYAQVTQVNLSHWDAIRDNLTII